VSSNEQPTCLEALIVHHTVDAVIYADTEGAVRLWNAAAEQIFAFAADDAIGGVSISSFPSA